MSDLLSRVSALGVSTLLLTVDLSVNGAQATLLLETISGYCMQVYLAPLSARS